MSVFLRSGSPYYYTNFQIGGTKFLRSTKKTSRREAISEARRIRDAERAARAAARNTVALTIDQGFGRYWTEHGSKLAPVWASEVKRYITQILAVVDKTMPLTEVSDSEVNDFVQARMNDGGGNYAINRALAVWRGMHRRAKKRWKQKVQEIDWAEFRNPEDKRVKCASIEELGRLLASVPERVSVAIEWSFYTGCRKFETYGLMWEQVDLEQCSAKVIRKGGKEHTIWLSPQAVALLARIERKGRYVFDDTNLRRIFERGVKKAGLGDFRWHDLRHTHATWLGDVGAPIEVVQRSLGHRDVETTMRYRHVRDPQLREALRNLPSLSTITADVVPFSTMKSHGNVR